MSIKSLWKLVHNRIIPPFKSSIQPHHDPRLQPFWNFAQLGLLLFPSIPILGAVGLLVAVVGTWKQKVRQIIRRPVNRGLAILSLCLVITTIFAREPLEALLGLGNLLPDFLVFAGLSALIQTPKQLRQLSWSIVLASFPVIIFGLGQQFFGWTGPMLFYPILGWVLEPNGNPPGRMASVFMYANILAAYLTIVLILGLGLWIEAWQRVKQKGSLKTFLETVKNSHSSPFLLTNYQLPILTLAIIGNAICLIFTNSRNAWGLAMFASLAFALYLGWRGLIAGVAAITGSIFWSAFGPEPVRGWLRRVIPYFIWGRITDQMYANRPLETLRTTQWQFAWKMTQERPWTGWGLRNFTPLYEAQMHIWLGHPHNLFLMLTAEIGIPATLFFCSLVGWILAQGIVLLITNSKTQNLVKKLESGSQFPSSQSPKSARDSLIFFSYLIAFIACILFNTVDVTLFDFRVNTLGWLLLAAIAGVVNSVAANPKPFPTLDL
ncbi:MAG: O-antigen ligase family protein [Actinomycetota bacterium]